MTPEKWRVVAIMLFATLAVSLGEALLAKGMRSTNVAGPGLTAQVRAILNWAVICGTLLMASYFALYMLALKSADLSFVLPLTAISYLLGAGLARYYLHEQVSPTRWLGALIITAGVIVVGLGESAGPGR